MKFYRGIMTVIINSVGASLVVPISQVFIKQFSQMLSYIFAALLSAFIIIIAKGILLELPYLFKPLRQCWLPISRMEGAWIETVNRPGERVLSVAYIKYHPLRKKHYYTGAAYDKYGNKKATWNANHLSHESGDDIYAFTFTGEGTYIESNQKVRTVGQVSFSSIDPLCHQKLTKGHGAYYDYNVNNSDEDSEETKNTFKLNKLTKKDYIKYIGKKKITTEDDERKFIINYYKDKSVSKSFINDLN